MKIADEEFEIERELIDVTRDGLFGGPIDTVKRYAPGALTHRINGVVVSEEEFNRRLEEAKSNQ